MWVSVSLGGVIFELLSASSLLTLASGSKMGQWRLLTRSFIWYPKCLVGYPLEEKFIQCKIEKMHFCSHRLTWQTSLDLYSYNAVTSSGFMPCVSVFGNKPHWVQWDSSQVSKYSIGVHSPGMVSVICGPLIHEGLNFGTDQLAWGKVTTASHLYLQYEGKYYWPTLQGCCKIRAVQNMCSILNAFDLLLV